MAAPESGTVTVTVRELLDLLRQTSGAPGGFNGVDSWRGPTAPPIPLIDPTLNVKEAMGSMEAHLQAMAALREHFEDKRVENDRRWQERLDSQKERADVARQEREAARIDSRITDVVRSADLSTERLTNAATILANTVATTADTAQKALVAAADVQREMVGQVRDTVTALQGVVTTFIATGGGERSAKTEQEAAARWSQRELRGGNEWRTGLYVTIGIAVAGIILKALHVI